MNILIINIALLVNIRTENKLLRGNELSHLPCIENAYLIIKDGNISSYGQMDVLPTLDENNLKTIDAKGTFVLPCWCDSHTHLVFAASREEEFVDKIKGLSYADIVVKGGGILNSARALNAMPEDVLFE